LDTTELTKSRTTRKGEREGKGEKKSENRKKASVDEEVVSYTKWGCMSEVVIKQAENALGTVYHMCNLNKGDNGGGSSFCYA
jgi:hypothetical protein